MVSEEPETRIAHFRILSLLGAGGMGVVYRARDERLERDVALKVIGEEHVAQPEYRRRLLREARAAAAVVHPGFAAVYEIGEDAGRLFIAMELLEGTTLRGAVGTLSPRRALELTAAIAEALARAHEAGIVHRDVKPDNVFLTEGGGLKLLDFGIARRDAPESSGEGPAEAATREGAVLGTPGYMSPEQALGHAVGPATDLFSLGVVLYELLAGCLPFGGVTSMERAIAVTRDEPAPLADLVALPREVTTLVHRCLEKEPSARPASASDLAQRLRRLAAEADTPALQTLVAAPHRGPARAAQAPRSARLALFAAPALLLAGLVALVVPRVLVSGRDPGAAPSSAPSSAPALAAPTATLITSLVAPASGKADAQAAFVSALGDLRRGDWTRAREDLRAAVAKDPSFVLAQLRLAHVEGVMGDAGEARRRLRWVTDHEAALDARHRAWLRGVEALLVHEPADYLLASRRFEEGVLAWPDDAELHFMLASALASANSKARSPGGADALDHARRAIELDPEYGDALQVAARLLSHRGDAAGALAYLDRCLAARSLDCLSDRLRLRAHAGLCAEVVSDAKLLESRGGKGSRHWVYAASALLAQGESVDAARAFLERADRDANDPWSRAFARLGRLHLAALTGDFTGLSGALEAHTAEAPGLEHLGALAALAARAHLESGAQGRAADVAGAFLSKRHLANGGFLLPTHDPSPLLWRVLSLTGKLPVAERAEKVDRWRRQQPAGFDEGRVWFQGLVLAADTKADADAALASQPAGFAVALVQDQQLGWDALGRVHRLAGRPETAAGLLEQATKSCTLLLYPFAHLQAYAELAELPGAPVQSRCAAYQQVARWWGKAKPRSLTAERAAAGARALRCPAARGGLTRSW